MSDLLLRNIRLADGTAADIRISEGRITAIGPDLSAGSIQIEDGGGAIALPGLVEAHTHLDKTLWGMDWYPARGGGDLQDLIDNERVSRGPLGLDVHRQSMRHALRLVATGTTLIRSHVDIDTDHGLSLFEGLAHTRDALADEIEIEIVAFPQSGLMVRPGTVDLMHGALAAGADIVGGLDPCSMDRDPKGHLDAIFAMADRYGKPVDIHLHEPGELGAFSLELILERTRALGMAGRVAVSHAFCLGDLPADRTAALMAAMAAQDVAVFTTGHPSATVPALLDLRAAGIRVGMGCDGIRDTWGPWGWPDMLQRACIVGMRNGLRTDAELATLLDTATTGGAAATGRTGHALAVGAPADLTLVTGETPAHALVELAPRPLVLKAGRVVARNGHAVRAAP
ncbi:MAG: amidohydrolase family protein [Roseinatronobacter sp.]